jgi:hypothetical protein
MKIVGVELKEIKIGKFFPKENKLELDIFFNDGSEKEVFKVVDASDPESAAETIIIDLRKLEKNIHKSSGGESIVDSAVNIVVKEEERLLKEIPKFIQKAKNKMDEIKNKNVADGYLDLIRELKDLKVKF